MKQSKGYTNCQSEDFDPFNNCNPVNCEEKYFGKRNFFDGKKCVPAIICEPNVNVVYEHDTNKCRNLKNILDDEDRKSMERGKFSNWVDEAEVKQDFLKSPEVS